MTNEIPPLRALISVSDKSGITALVQTLLALNYEILATDGTLAYLKSAGVNDLQTITELTQFPHLLDGRVKTLHPHVFAGILARGEKDAAELHTHKIKQINLVVVNLYPFAKTMQDENATLPEIIEQIDIGGVSLLRAAAKNFQYVAVVCDVADYTMVTAELQKNHGIISEKTRLYLAAKAFQLTAHYDQLIANYFQNISSIPQKSLPQQLYLNLNKKLDFRYGENPDQQAALYVEEKTKPSGLAFSENLQGKTLSYNNYLDADVAWQCVNEFTAPTCVIVKHANPCGVALKNDLIAAYQAAFQCDAESAFGGIIAFNQIVSADLINIILKTQFVEMLIAPDFSVEAQTIAKEKKNLMLLKVKQPSLPPNFEYKTIENGVLVQTIQSRNCQFTVVTQQKNIASQQQDIEFAWRVIRYVKSNAMVLVHNQQTIGIGAGQPSRIGSLKIAIEKARSSSNPIEQAILCSDGFIPFRDCIDIASEVGIKILVQPGGSIRDNEIIAAANERGMIMIFTGQRQFKH